MIKEIFVLLFFFRGIEDIHSPEIVFVEVFSGGMKAYFLLLHEQILQQQSLDILLK